MTAHDDAVQELIRAGREIVDRGLALGSGGNLSVRISEHSFVVTAAGTWLDRLSPEDFSVLDMTGAVHAGTPRPSSEWKLHQRTYARRPDLRAIVHVHPQHAVLLTALGHDIRLLTLDHAYYVRSIGTTPFYPNGSDELADSAAEAASQHDCVVLSNHGCSTMGDSLEMALRRALNLEEAATTTYRAILLGDHVTQFPPEQFARLHHD